jgi:competence protein ComEC
MTPLKEQITANKNRLSLWSPVMLMVGIAWYFSLSKEPYVYVGIIALAVSMLFLALAWRSAFRTVFIALLLVTLGFTVAQWRAYRMATPLLSSELHYREVEGTIDEIEPTEKKEKLVLSKLEIEGVAQADTPLRIRITFRGNNPLLSVGDRVRFHANLYPLPSANMPNAYDFARHFYFRGIGGTGFAMREAQKVASNPSGWSAYIGNLRHAIGEDMRNSMKGDVGAISAAMTVGEMGPISQQAQDSLRDSGLSHILSISGLHLAIAAGIIFFNVRLLLTLIPAFALRFPVKKIAAVCAIISAFLYLALAGFPVPAQRAFLMVLFLFTAVLLDRRGITLRTLSFAACIILVLFPESMLGASFQMSFAATLAIVALYEAYGKSLSRPSSSVMMRMLRSLLGIMVTSLAATLATSVFVLTHFNRFALLGIVSNMVVIPLATLTIMPGMAVALLLMPFGWQEFGYSLMAFGTDIMIKMSDLIAQIPGSTLQFPSPTHSGFIIAAGGLLWVCLWTNAIRFLGVIMMIGGLSTITNHVPVDVFISREARQVMVRLDDGHYTALRGTDRSFVIKNWLRSEGEEGLVAQKQTNTLCDRIQCSLERIDFSIALIKKPDQQVVDAACKVERDVLVAWWPLSADQCPGPVMLIGKAELERFGAHTLRFSAAEPHIEYTRKEDSQRLWHPVLTQGEEEEY